MSLRIGCDVHKRYSQFAVVDETGQLRKQARVNHGQHHSICNFLSDFPPGTRVALESVGNWYWIADEIEAAGCVPLLTQAAKAKVMMGNINKTDKLDAKGLAVLLHNGVLPVTWLPPAEIRDERELPRTRMALRRLRTILKNRVHSTLAKYALVFPDYTDLFSVKGKAWMEKTAIPQLPPETGRCVRQELQLINDIQAQITQLESRIKERVKMTGEMQLLKTLPGVADILAIVIEREVGDIDRFPSAGHFSSYSGVVPTVHSSGGKTRYGHLRKESNQYLKWAFVEAANAVVNHRHDPGWSGKHVVLLYNRVRQKKGHAVAVGAMARHLSEAAYWMLRKGEVYQEPRKKSEFSEAVVSASLT